MEISPANQMIDMAGARFESVAVLGEHDEDTVLFRTRMAPERTVPLHSHMDPECFYILSGSIEVFLIDDMPQWHVVAPGRSLLIKDGMKHAICNRQKEPADMILVTNNRLARYFREAGRTVEPGEDLRPPSPEDLERLIRVSKSYGYWLTSPPESDSLIKKASEPEPSPSPSAAADLATQSAQRKSRL